MKIHDVMNTQVHSVESTAGIAEAAHAMGKFDVGALPVVDDGDLVGIVTDRDITVRGLAEGLNSGASVMRVMSADAICCRDDDDFADVLETMAREQIRRMPVRTRSGELVGMVSLGDLARQERRQDEVTEALSYICRPFGYHSQRRHSI